MKYLRFFESFSLVKNLTYREAKKFDESHRLLNFSDKDLDYITSILPKGFDIFEDKSNFNNLSDEYVTEFLLALIENNESHLNSSSIEEISASSYNYDFYLAKVVYKVGKNDADSIYYRVDTIEGFKELFAVFKIILIVLF